MVRPGVPLSPVGSRKAPWPFRIILSPLSITLYIDYSRFLWSYRLSYADLNSDCTLWWVRATSAQHPPDTIFFAFLPSLLVGPNVYTGADETREWHHPPGGERQCGTGDRADYKPSSQQRSAVVTRGREARTRPSSWCVWALSVRYRDHYASPQRICGLQRSLLLNNKCVMAKTHVTYRRLMRPLRGARRPLQPAPR